MSEASLALGLNSRDTFGISSRFKELRTSYSFSKAILNK
jgi:hypothetical protein